MIILWLTAERYIELQSLQQKLTDIPGATFCSFCRSTKRYLSSYPMVNRVVNFKKEKRPDLAYKIENKKARQLVEFGETQRRSNS